MENKQTYFYFPCLSKKVPEQQYISEDQVCFYEVFRSKVSQYCHEEK